MTRKPKLMILPSEQEPSHLDTLGVPLVGGAAAVGRLALSGTSPSLTEYKSVSAIEEEEKSKNYAPSALSIPGLHRASRLGVRGLGHDGWLTGYRGGCDHRASNTSGGHGLAVVDHRSSGWAFLDWVAARQLREVFTKAFSKALDK
jgi:hypothetical protein